ncbi:MULTISPECIES: hypothetical protein [unclassified Aureimonas]|uniref:hypothetical protein n=1 Tax=unclassified Aureimonas TaxID=2615206 RepID=UPI0012E34DC1|nr:MULTISPECIES: hypothetical protein [unclassified Aureimonas]
MKEVVHERPRRVVLSYGPSDAAPCEVFAQPVDEVMVTENKSWANDRHRGVPQI